MEHDAIADAPLEAPHGVPGVVHLWVGIIVAPLAWSLHLLCCYSLAAHACFPTDVALGRPLWPDLRTIVAAVTAMAWLTIVFGSGGAWLNWKATGSASGAGPSRILQTGDGRPRFMALCGLLVSTVFAVALCFTTIGVFLPPEFGP